MPIPRNEETLLPILQFLAGRKEASNREIYEYIEKVFKLSPEEKSARFASSKKVIYQNHVRWGLLILRKAGLTRSPESEMNAITEYGKEVLSKNKKIDLKVIRQSKEYSSWERGFGSSKSILEEAKDTTEETPSPEDLLEAAYKRNKEVVKEELLALIRSKSGDSSFLEQLVADLVKKMGYYDAEVTGRPYDGGIDGTVYVDPLKTDFFKFQAKNWGNDVGTDEIKNFVASFRPQLKGLFVTTSKFHAGVTKYLDMNRDLNVILIDQ